MSRTCSSLGSEERLREQTEKEYAEEMGEDEYDALPDEEKQRIDQRRLQQKKDRILRYDQRWIMFFVTALMFLENNDSKKKRLD
jgi:hypothetical protein